MKTSAAAATLICFLLGTGFCSKRSSEVVLYTSADEPFAVPIIKDFEAKSGIHVRPVYDVEASKTTGLVNRLIAEKDRPQADAFWSSEVVRTVVLARKEVLSPYCSPFAADIPTEFKDSNCRWTGFAARARVLLARNKDLDSADDPKSVFDLAAPRWRHSVALPYPLFGTTSAHIASWYLTLGPEKARKFLEELKANEVLVVDGNAGSRDRVVAGDAKVGFMDTDDANGAIQDKKPVRMIYPDQDGIGTLLIPNTVALVKGGPNPEAGKRLIDYLLSKEVEAKLAAMESAQIPLRRDVPHPANVRSLQELRIMKVDYDKLTDQLDVAMTDAQRIFVR